MPVTNDHSPAVKRPINATSTQTASPIDVCSKALTAVDDHKSHKAPACGPSNGAMRHPNQSLAFTPEPAPSLRTAQRVKQYHAQKASPESNRRQNEFPDLATKLCSSDKAVKERALKTIYQLTQRHSDYAKQLDAAMVLRSVADALQADDPECTDAALHILVDLIDYTNCHDILFSTEGLMHSMVDFITGRNNHPFGLSTALTALSHLATKTDCHEKMLMTPGLVDGLDKSLYTQRNPYAVECSAKALAHLTNHRNNPQESHSENQHGTLNKPSIISGLVYVLNRSGRSGARVAAAEAFRNLSACSTTHGALKDKELIDFFQSQHNKSYERGVKSALQEALKNLGCHVKPMITLYRGVRHAKTVNKVCNELRALPNKGRIDGIQTTATASRPKRVSPEQFKMMASGRGRLRNQALHTFSGFTTRFTAYTSWTTEKSLAESFAYGPEKTNHPERSMLLKITLSEDDPRIASKKCGGIFMNALISCGSENEYYIDTSIDDTSLEDIEVSYSIAQRKVEHNSVCSGWG